MIDFAQLGVQLFDAFSYAINTALAVLGLCVVAIVAYRWVSGGPR